MSDSVRPQRQQPTRLPRPWDSPGKNTGVGCHFLLQCMKVKSLSRVQLLATPWNTAYEAPPSMGFSRQEYWSGVPLLSPAFLSMTPQKTNANAPFIQGTYPGVLRFMGSQSQTWLSDWTELNWTTLLAWYSGKVITWAQISDVPLLCRVTLASYLASLS